jgi:flavin reductase (DIM6/NTAB) family NADH-FMN oxidoreductase RutF
MHLDPAALAQADRYKLLIGGIVPRPIAFVSTVSKSGALNLAPFSFFAGVGSEPMSLLFCPANNADGSMKDTLRNIAEGATEGDTSATGDWGAGGSGGEFVVNIVSEAFERQMAACAEPLPYGHSEFDLAGLTPEPSKIIKPPRVAESPLSFECRALRIIRLAPGIPAGGNIVVGQIVHIHAADGLINDRYHVDPDKLGAIARMGGMGYLRTSDPDTRFEMPMGRAAIQA